MPHLKNLIGQKFGKLTVLEFTVVKYRSAHWLCKCDCGNIKEAKGADLKSGKKKYFRCCAPKKIGRFTGNKKQTGEYISWQAAIQRCTNQNKPEFFRYGMRGISVCERWLHSFDNFFADMGLRPTPKHTLDRIDNNGNYEPSNCRWATRKEQSNNMSGNHWMVCGGERKNANGWADYLGVSRQNLNNKLKLNTIDEIVTTFSNQNKTR